MILFVDDLTVMDFSYLCPVRGVVGESWIVDIELEGGLDHQNMVLDFGKVKKNIKRIIDNTVDHKLVVPGQSSATRYVAAGSIARLDFNTIDKRMISLRCPSDAFAVINAEEITKEVVIEYLIEKLTPSLPTNVKSLNISLRDENISGAFYHYTHGLKKHDGNCQRIAHGHRSTIKIFKDGHLDEELNSMWAERWKDIYLGSQEDLVMPEESSLYTGNSDGHHFFKYQAMQGEFEMAIGKAHCEIVDCDTTVECLAQYIADDLKNSHPSHKFKVKAFEGVGKGAIAYA